MDTIKLINEYLSREDWRVKENSNAGYSLSGLQLHLADNLIKDYMLATTYKGPIALAHNDGYIYIHDLGINSIYCLGHDLRKLLEEGYNGVPEQLAAAPPKHLRSALNQMVNYLASCQSDSAGANAFANVDTLLAPFVRIDDLSYEEVKQGIQEFIYSLNVSNRVGFQKIFSNVTFDLKCPENFKEHVPKIGGKDVSFKYGECNTEIGMISKAFFEVMMDGDAEGKPFSFPIPTVNLHKNFVWDDDVAKCIFEATAKYGLPSFQNFLSGDIDPDDTYSMCCRLRIDKSELKNRSGGLFGAGAGTGSIGVCTINLPLLAYESKNKEELFKKIDTYMNIAKEQLEIKRVYINDKISNNYVPYVKRYLGHTNNHFSTIGVIGANEMCLNLIKKDLTTQEGQDLTNEVLSYMNARVKEFQLETGNFYNLEQTPAEGACYKMAKLAKKKYPSLITAGTDETPYLTNSSHLPVNHKLTMRQMLKTQDMFNKHYNGGTICHVFLGQRVTDWINCMLLVKKIAEMTTLPFFDLVPDFSICPVHGYISGSHETCPLEHTEEDLKKYGVIKNE